MARPGYFLIDTNGVIREKFFEAKYRERLSGNNVIVKLFPELGEEVTNSVEAPHLQLTVTQSDRIAYPGSRITLTAEVKLPADVHVYAPGTKGYIPIQLEIGSTQEAQDRLFTRYAIFCSVRPPAAVTTSWPCCEGRWLRLVPPSSV
jgi:hypothetical protein